MRDSMVSKRQFLKQASSSHRESSHHSLHDDMSWLDQSTVGHARRAEGGSTFRFRGPPIHLTWGSHCFHSLNERPIRLYNTDDHDQWDADHRRKGKTPAQANCPVRVYVLLVIGQWCILGQRKDKAPHAENWCD